MRCYLKYLYALLHILKYPQRPLVVLFAICALHIPHYLFGVYGVAILVNICIAPPAAESEHSLYLLVKNKNKKWKTSNANTE